MLDMQPAGYYPSSKAPAKPAPPPAKARKGRAPVKPAPPPEYNVGHSGQGQGRDVMLSIPTYALCSGRWPQACGVHRASKQCPLVVVQLRRRMLMRHFTRL